MIDEPRPQGRGSLRIRVTRVAVIHFLSFAQDAPEFILKATKKRFFLQ
jgi:hypothetical protein